MYKILLFLLLIINYHSYAQTTISLYSSSNGKEYNMTCEVESSVNNYYTLGGSYNLLNNNNEFCILNSITLIDKNFGLHLDVEVGSYEELENNNFIATTGVGFDDSIGNIEYTICPRLVYDSNIRFDILLGCYYKYLVFEMSTDGELYEISVGVKFNLRK